MNNTKIGVMKSILYIIKYLLILTFGYFIYNKSIEPIEEILAFLTLYIAIFSFVLAYILKYTEVKINPFETSAILLTFIVITMSLLMIAFGIASFSMTIYKIILMIIFFHLIEIIYVFSIFYYKKIIYSNIIKIKLKSSKRKLKKIYDLKSEGDIEVVYKDLISYINKNYLLKNYVSLKDLFQSIQEISKEVYKKEIEMKLNHKEKEYSLYKLLKETYKLVLKRRSKRDLVCFIDLAIEISNNAAIVKDWDQNKQILLLIFSEMYETCLQINDEYGEIIVSKFASYLSSKILKEDEHKKNIFNVIETMLVQIRKYYYNITQLSIDYLYQEYLLNCEIFINVKGINSVTDTAIKCLKLNQEINKKKDYYFEYHKFFDFILKMENINDIFSIINRMKYQTDSNDAALSEMFEYLYNKLNKRYPEEIYKITDHQISTYRIIDIDPKYLCFDVIFEILISNDSENIISEIIYDIAMFIGQNKSDPSVFFYKLRTYIENNELDNDKIRLLLKRLRYYIYLSVKFNESESIERLIISISRLYIFMLDKYSSELYKKERKDIFKNYYMFQVKELFLQVNLDDHKLKILDLLFKYTETDRDYEKKCMIKNILEFGYRSIESNSYDMIEAISNILGWSLINNLNKIKNEESTVYDNKLISEINDFFKLVVKFSSRKTSIFVGTLFVVNYVYCEVYSHNSKVLKNAMLRFQNLLSSSTNEIKSILRDSATIRSKHIYYFFEEDKSLNISKIDSSCDKFLKHIS